MAYTMLKNQGRRKDYSEFSLEGAALKFIRESCEELRFSKEKENIEGNGNFQGTSRRENQIPYNMEMDIDRLCLEKALECFLASGKKEDAFNVYFCYLEIFVGDYEKTRRMIELLSEFEANGSALLMKHRDHYSHSVYVFALGLAIYETNDIYRHTYRNVYKLNDKKEAAYHYLQYWGLASLFHDIGYPFELPFEQVSSYFEVAGDDRTKRPYIAYHGLESFVKFDKIISRKIAKLYGNSQEVIFENTDELFAYILAEKLSKTYLFTKEQMLTFLKEKPTQPNKFNYYMDHAYFSATVLFKKLFCEMECELHKEHLDALTAILMHNSLYKFCIAYYKDRRLNIPFEMKNHPLAFMLMLCDELQCWDRTAYGRHSKKELYPFKCEFDLSNDQIKVDYFYDKKQSIKIDKYKEEYNKWKEKKKNLSSKQEEELWKKSEPKLKAYSEMYVKNGEKISDFQQDIGRIVELWNQEKTERGIKLDVNIKQAEMDFNHRTYLSDSNFLNLYQFAIILNGRWENIDAWKKAKKEGKVEEFLTDKSNEEKFLQAFKRLSLEYKIFNINQAKAFARYMNEIGCFYTDKKVDFKIVESFSKKERICIGIMEHQRWLQEHYDMGWEYGSTSTEKEREQLRQHHDMISSLNVLKEDVTKEQAKENYERLGKEEQDKDEEPMECVLAMLKMLDGIQIYKLK